MRARTKLVAVVGAVALASPLVAEADLVESFEESDSHFGDDFACALVTFDDGATSTYIDLCGIVSDTDGDGLGDRAGIGVYREECNEDGSFWRCRAESGWSEVPSDQVVIDRDGGTASINGAVDSCNVQVDFSATEDASEFDFSSVRPAPQVRLHSFEVVVERGWEHRYEYAPADAEGSVCDWYSGDFGYAEIGGAEGSRVERGYRVHPEEAPVVGGAIVRGESPGPSEEWSNICGYWDRSTSEGEDEYVHSCATVSDSDGDGGVDSSSVWAFRGRCDEVSCWSESRSGELTQFSQDFDAGVASFAGTAEGCSGGMSVTVHADDGYEGDHTSERDAIGVTPDGDVVIGERTSSDFRHAYGSLGDGVDVCGWVAGVDWAYSGGDFGSSAEHHTYLTVGVDPDGLG